MRLPCGKKRRRFLLDILWILRWLAFSVFFYLSGCLLLLAAYGFTEPPLTSVQLQRRLEAWIHWDAYSSRQTVVPLARISRNLQHAVIAAEDGAFYEHSGIDWEELEKAYRENLRRGELWRGGSTLTQQLVKNLFLFADTNIWRKGFEFVLAPLAEVLLSKERILELYLNHIEWGPGIWGVEAAANYHYQTSAADLNRYQAASLAACIPNPRRRTPSNVPRYTSVILQRMASRGW